MGIKLITAPSVEPVSLAEAKEHLIVEHTNHDALIAAAILSAREWVEQYTGRCLISQTWELALDEFPEEIELKKIPAISISSVKYINTSNVETTINASNYGVDDYSPRHWLIPTDSNEWPTPLDSANSVKVQYVAGYGTASTDVPGPIIQAVKLLIGDFYEHRENTVIGAPVASTETVKMLLSMYRVVAL